jgi:hypothetical protein
MKQIILLGQEAAGNHAICSLFSHIDNVMGTDLAGWDDGVYKEHSSDLFDDVWLGKKGLIQDRHIVTSRSVPCGLIIPDLDAFIKQCSDPLLVVITRDQTIIQRCTEKKNDRLPACKSLVIINDLIKNYNPVFFSYESAIAFKSKYVHIWLKDNLPGFNLNPIWLNYLRDENKKYII